MSEQFEGDPPLLAVAIERGGVLIDAHDETDPVLEVLVGEGDPFADAEVATSRDLRWRNWPGEFDVRRRRPSVGRRRVGRNVLWLLDMDAIGRPPSALERWQDREAQPL